VEKQQCSGYLDLKRSTDRVPLKLAICRQYSFNGKAP